MIHKDMTNKAYHSLSAISSTAVKTVSKSSIAHWVGAKRHETPAMVQGSAIHSLALEPKLKGVVRGPYSRRGGAWKEAVFAAEAINEDAIVLPEREYDEIEAIANSARENPVLKDYLNSDYSRIEMSITLHDPDYDLDLRARPDLYNSNGTIIDLKSTLDASPAGFTKSAYNLGYFTQAAFYRRVLELEGLKVSEFLFLAVEKSAPYLTCAHGVSETGMALGEIEMHKALKQIAEYKKTGVANTGWPEISMLSPPGWALDYVSTE